MEDLTIRNSRLSAQTEDSIVSLRLAHFCGIRLAFSVGGAAGAEICGATALAAGLQPADLVEQTRSFNNLSFMRLFHKGV
jgi:hypothetical protein